MVLGKAETFLPLGSLIRWWSPPLVTDIDPIRKGSRRMARAKLIVMYPSPNDVEAFEAVYRNEHVPLAVSKLQGKTKIVATKVLGSPQGAARFYRIAEVHFPSMEALEACAASEGAKETLANAVKISTGGEPIFLVAEEETFKFQQ